MEAKSELLLTSLILLSGRDPFDLIKIKPSRNHCVQCQQEIPPGRAGRCCKTCREKKE